VVYVGGVDAAMKPKDTRTPAQKASLLAVRDALRAKYPTISKVSGHRDYAAKACPSFDVHADPLGVL
jgi:N-acetylmuramoyl-L-alanine amidase